MFFAVSKVLTFVFQPSSLAAIALFTGLLLMRKGNSRAGARLAWGGFGYFVICGILPVGNAMVSPLEERFARVAAPGPQDTITGIIILGGFEDGWVTGGRGQLTVNESAERLMEGTRLALRHPAAKIVFTSGVGALWRTGLDATQAVESYFVDAGIARERIVLEGRSRNTAENALYSAEMLRPAPGQRWVIVTSAYHMPRAVGLYRKAGFEVLAYPVDYRTRGPEDVTRLFDRIPAGLQRMDLAVNEWLGLTMYWATGRIDALFPAPGP